MAPPSVAGLRSDWATMNMQHHLPTLLTSAEFVSSHHVSVVRPSSVVLVEVMVATHGLGQPVASAA
jgi:hypothetical protein